MNVGVNVGNRLGVIDGVFVGAPFGLLVGSTVPIVGVIDGILVGLPVDSERHIVIIVGIEDICVGFIVGFNVGLIVGLIVGIFEGI